MIKRKQVHYSFNFQYRMYTHAMAYVKLYGIARLDPRYYSDEAYYAPYGNPLQIIKQYIYETA